MFFCTFQLIDFLPFHKAMRQIGQKAYDILLMIKILWNIGIRKILNRTYLHIQQEEYNGEGCGGMCYGENHIMTHQENLMLTYFA